MSNETLNWVHNNKGLTIIRKGYQPITLRAEKTKDFKSIVNDLMNKKYDKVILELFSTERLKKYTKGQFKLQEKENKISVIDTKTNKEMPEILAKKLMSFSKEGLPYRALKKFWENLKKNPDNHSIEQLYGFLDRYEVPITEDGCFLAYKYVAKCKDGQLRDSHTKSLINDPGSIVAMDRSNCDHNPSITCSTGLHVAVFSYARECGNGQEIIEVKVNPKDVVSIPIDYEYRKMRVCRYEVTRMGQEEVKASYKRAKNLFAVPIKDPGLNLEAMSAKEIIDVVKEKTGQLIKLSLKSKKSIIKKATEILSNIKRVQSQDQIDLSGKSAKEIIAIVKAQTGHKIKLSLKSKKSILKRAALIFNEHGLKIKV